MAGALPTLHNPLIILKEMGGCEEFAKDAMAFYEIDPVLFNFPPPPSARQKNVRKGENGRVARTLHARASPADHGADAPGILRSLRLGVVTGSSGEESAGGVTTKQRL